MRSKWKGPYVHPGLLSRVRQFLISGKKQRTPFIVMSRESTIVPEFMGLRFDIHTGKTFTPVEIKDFHLGHKFGDFSFTRVSPISVFDHESRRALQVSAMKGKKK